MLPGKAAEVIERTRLDDHHQRHDLGEHEYTQPKMLFRLYAQSPATKGTKTSIEQASQTQSATSLPNIRGTQVQNEEGDLGLHRRALGGRREEDTILWW